MQRKKTFMAKLGGAREQTVQQPVVSHEDKDKIENLTMKIEELSEELSHVNVQREELEARIKQLVEENEGLKA